MPTHATHMPEAPIWEPGIYQLEVTDKILGYDPETGLDGPSNLPWKQLTNRTRFLREILGRNHGEHGEHALRDADFVAGAAIPESKIALDHGTEGLLDRALALADLASNAEADLLDRDAAGDLAFTLAMTKVIPLSWDFSGSKYAFELFSPSMTLGLPRSFTVTRAVTGDDSINVLSTSGMAPGDEFVMTNASGSVYEFVTVSNVLSSTRAVLSRPASVDLEFGYLRSSNVPAEHFTADVEAQEDGARDFAYVSDFTDAFAPGRRTELHIRHTPEHSALITVEYSTGPAWAELARIRRDEFSSDQADVFAFPSGVERAKIRVTYRGLSEPTSFTGIMLMSEQRRDVLEDVLSPSVLYSGAVRDQGMVGRVHVLTMPGTLYGGTLHSLVWQTAADAAFSTVLEERTFESVEALHGEGEVADYVAFEDAAMQTMVELMPTSRDDLEDLRSVFPDIVPGTVLTYVAAFAPGSAFIRFKYVYFGGEESRWSAPVAIPREEDAVDMGSGSGSGSGSGGVR